VGHSAHTKTPSAKPEHLGHKRQRINAATRVERGQDFLLAAHLYEITGAVA
jgi:hypothetical protein